MKMPWMQWFATDWLNDPQVSICEPATRGILMDWLCNMHLLDRCGQITGTPEQLARLGRCTSVQVESALTDLNSTKAADVTFRNGVVTVTNRRMKREANARKNGAIRVQRHRSNAACNASVTPHSQSHKSESESEEREPEGARAHFLEAEIPSWEEFWEYCQSPHCGIAAEWFAKDKFLAGPANGWQKTPWRNFAQRIKGWWEQDGRPMKPKSRDGKALPTARAPGAPTRQEVNDFAAKWADEKGKDRAKAINMAVSFYQFWNHEKRQWKKSNATLDWQSELQIQLGKMT